MQEYKEYVLKYRTRVSTSINNDILEIFNEYVQETQIDKSKLFDKAVILLLKEVGKLPHDYELKKPTYKKPKKRTKEE